MRKGHLGLIASCVIIGICCGAPARAADTSSKAQSAHPDWLGKNDFIVWKMTRANGCSYPRLVEETPSTEVFQIVCAGEQPRYIHCEFTNCKMRQ